MNIKITIKDNENKDFYLEIKIKDKELIICSESYKYNYSISYSIEELQLTNELFSLYNNIQEIFDVLKDLFSNSYKPPVIDNKNFNLIFFVKLGKIQTITISLIEKKNIFVKLNNQIYDEIEQDVNKLDSIIESNKK